MLRFKIGCKGKGGLWNKENRMEKKSGAPGPDFGKKKMLPSI
jgi:hypothetical protein